MPNHEPPTDPNSDDSRGFGCAILFLLPFALVGFGMAWLIVASVWTWLDTRSWVETPCTVLTAEVEEDWGDTTTYSVTASYEYEWQENAYQGWKVSNYFGSDNIGTFHITKARELKEKIAQGGKSRCFVNPDDPSEAVLFRDFRGEILLFNLAFVFTFGGVGFSGLITVWIQKKAQTFRTSARAEHPTEPWLWQPDWASRVIKPSRAEAAKQLFLATVVNGIAWPMTGVFILDPGIGRWIAVSFGVPLCFLGTWTGMNAIRLARDIWQGKLALLHLKAPTGTISGHICGEIRIDREWAPTDGFLVMLTLYQKAEAGTDSDGDTRYVRAARRQWQRRLQPATHDNTQNCVPFCFQIPDGLPPSNADKQITWQIEVLAPLRNRDTTVSFTVPVFRAEQPTWNCDHEESKTIGPRATLTECVERSGGRVIHESAKDCILEFPMGRLTSAAYSTGLLGLCLAVGGVFAYSLRWALIAIISPTIAVVCFQYAVRAYRDAREIVLSSDGILVHKTTGLFANPVKLSTEQIKRVATQLGKHGRQYEVFAERTDGKEYTIARDIKRLADARHLVKTIKSVTGLPTRRP